MKKLTTMLLLFLPTLATADPGPATKYLMNEPASLFDLGFLRAKLELERTKSTKASSIAHKYGGEIFYLIDMRYEFDNDLLVFVFNTPVTSDEKKVCDAFYDVYNGYIFHGLSDWFSHRGYTATDEPDKLIFNLRMRTQVVCSGG